MLKAFLTHFVAVSVGVIIGCVATTYLLADSFASDLKILSEGLVYEVERTAFEAYEKESSDIAIWSLRNYVDTLETEGAQSVMGDRWSCEMSAALARLARVVERSPESFEADRAWIIEKAPKVAAKCPDFRGDPRNTGDLAAYADRVDKLRSEVRSR